MKNVIITGSSGGLGLSIVKRLVENNYFVFGLDINQSGFFSPNFMEIKTNIMDKKSLERAKNKIKTKTKEIYAIINVAGIYEMSILSSLDSSDIVEKMLNVNLLGMIKVNSTFSSMLHRNARIINFSSECGFFKPQPFNGPYTITKYAVEAYNDSLQKELMFKNIYVIKIRPGSFKTNMHDKAKDEFNDLVKNKEYQDILLKMKKIMTKELQKYHKPDIISEKILKILKTRKPKLSYNIKLSFNLLLLQILPNRFINFLYLKMFHK